MIPIYYDLLMLRLMADTYYDTVICTVTMTNYVVDRARVNSPTQYSPEAPAEGLYQVGLFTSALSHLYHGYFKYSPVSSRK